MAIKKFQGQNFDRIYENTKNELIYEAILDQEEQYMEHVIKYKKQLRESKDPRERICSRLLKYSQDEQLLRRRTFADDVKLIRAQIDENIPLVDPSEQNNKSPKKSAKKGAKGSPAKRGAKIEDENSSNTCVAK